MRAPFVRSIRLDSFLSFAPGSEPVALQPLNVLIGPNGSGKSNFIEAFSLLGKLGSGDEFQAALRAGGGASEWVWKGADASSIELELNGEQERRFEYRVAWTPRAPGAAQATFLDERFAELPTVNGNPITYFQIDGRHVTLSTQLIGPNGPEAYTTQSVERQYFNDSTSLLSQRRTPGAYPDNIWLADHLAKISEFREWTFGRTAAPRRAQRTDAPSDALLAEGSNLAMMLQELSHVGKLDMLNEQLRRFLPRAARLAPRLSGGTILAYLHEEEGRGPIPATRLSDGTLRFVALLVALLIEPTPPLICIEEPELGLHPDALSLVAELLIEASSRTQLIVTTHSEALVSALSLHVDSVLVCENIGGTQLRRLSADALSHWLDRYRLGELWRIGELGGNP